MDPASVERPEAVVQPESGVRPGVGARPETPGRTDEAMRPGPPHADERQPLPPTPPFSSRTAGTRLALTVAEPASLVLSVAVADRGARERLSVRSGEVELSVRELDAPWGTRLHLVDAPVGPLVVEYDALVENRSEPAPVDDRDDIVFRRPSRYCDSDRLLEVAYDECGRSPDPHDRVRAVVSWALHHISYVPGSSDWNDGAVQTYLRRRGVCRDTAHLVVAFVRALGIPARLVSVYAPGLRPMDQHAVVEVALDGRWYVVDATGLAPRSAMMRIATGRDAADTAFLTVRSGRIHLDSVRVHASAAPGLPADDGVTPTVLR